MERLIHPCPDGPVTPPARAAAVPPSAGAGFASTASGSVAFSCRVSRRSGRARQPPPPAPPPPAPPARQRAPDQQGPRAGVPAKTQIPLREVVARHPAAPHRRLSHGAPDTRSLVGSGGAAPRSVQGAHDGGDGRFEELPSGLRSSHDAQPLYEGGEKARQFSRVLVRREFAAHLGPFQCCGDGRFDKPERGRDRSARVTGRTPSVAALTSMQPRSGSQRSASAMAVRAARKAGRTSSADSRCATSSAALREV